MSSFRKLHKELRHIMVERLENFILNIFKNETQEVITFIEK